MAQPESSNESSSEDKGWPAWKTALVVAGVAGVVVVGAAVAAPAASASALNAAASALSSAASALSSAASALSSASAGELAAAGAAVSSGAAAARPPKTQAPTHAAKAAAKGSPHPGKPVPPLTVGDPNLGKPGDEFKVAQCKQIPGRAECWAWDRVIWATDVNNLVQRIRIQKGPRQYIVIGSGVHGCENQYKEVANLKLHEKNKGGNPALVNPFLPNQMAEFQFMREDFEAHAEDDHIVLYDLRKRPQVAKFKTDLSHPQNIVIFAMCYGMDSVYYKMEAETAFAQDWYDKHGAEVTYSDDA